MSPSISPHLQGWDISHTWGIYRERIHHPTFMQRQIRYFEGGRTSVHRHAVDERLTVQSGQILVLLGEDPNALTQHVLEPGASVDIPGGTWHAAECMTNMSVREPYAEAIENVYGSNHSGRYEIERAVTAIPSERLRAYLQQDVAHDWLAAPQSLGSAPLPST